MMIVAFIKPQGIENKIDYLLQMDNIDDIRGCYQSVAAAFADLKNWAVSTTGNVICDWGTHIGIQIPIDNVADLPNYIVKYEDTIGLPFSIGVGNSPLEAVKAMLVADGDKENHIVMYSDDVDKELSGEDSLDMSKAEDESFGIAMPNLPVEDESKKKPSENGEKKPEKPKANPKQKVVETLMQIKQILPQIQELKETNPAVYKSLKSVIDAMLLLAHGKADEKSK